MKIAASTAVARDSAVVAPRAPNTVPEAPAPKPAPASAPLPRCSRTRPMMARAENSCTIVRIRSEEHTSELQSHSDLVCRLLLEKKNTPTTTNNTTKSTTLIILKPSYRRQQLRREPPHRIGRIPRQRYLRWVNTCNNTYSPIPAT